jgi:glycosyltransferase involved in cell wall biosynthesis
VDDFRDFGIEAPIVSIPQGVDSELLRRNTPKPHEAPAWVYLGRLAVDQKGLDLLVKGYALLYEQRSGELPPLVLAGPDFREGKKQLEQLARSLGVTESIKFIGPVFGDDKWDVVAQAQLFVHTSRFDTTPFSVLEALALGRPVLVTPETGCGSYVQEHKAGWTVAATPEAIAKGLNTVLETSPQELDATGDRARSLARDTFSWPSWARQMAKVYREGVE